MTAHWRIRIRDRPRGTWRWHRDPEGIAEFTNKTAALVKLDTLEAFCLEDLPVAEAVSIPEGVGNADAFLGN
jgi:hypothetical protein